MTSDNAAAEWMVSRLKSDGILYQDDAVCEIERRFGADLVYDNASGNPAIRKTVLAVFRSLSEDWVVWERGERCWRTRENHDPPGRMTY